jgi:hypothetical protein
MALDDNADRELAIPTVTELLSELRRCGWREESTREGPEEFFFQTYQGGHIAPGRRLAGETGANLLLIGLNQVVLPADDELYQRFLNLPLEARMALTLAHRKGGLDWLLLLTRGRVELYRLPEETRECLACGGGEFQAEMLPALAALARGADAGLRSGPQPLPGAESLRGWLRHWSLQLGSAIEVPAETVERALWQWILMLQAARRQEGSEAGAHWGLVCEPQAGRWSVAYDALSTTDDLCRHLERFEDSFVSRIFELDRPELVRRLRRLEETSLLERLRAELLMQTQDRFEPETAAWLFTDLDHEQEGWRREMAGVGPVRARIAHDGWTIYRPLVCDVGRYGLTAALRDVERLAHYLNDQGQFARRRRAENPAAPVGQPDLFRSAPRGIGPRGQLDDGLNYLFGEALRLQGVPPEMRFGVGVVMLLKALALAPRLQWPFLGIDTLDLAFAVEAE